MWMTIPDDYQVHMMDRELVNYCTGQSGSGIVLPTAAEFADSPTDDQLVLQTISVLTAIGKEAQVIVTGMLAGQGKLIDPLPTPNPSADLLLHVVTHIAFEHLFLRIPGQASMYPSAWDKSIKDAHEILGKFVSGMLPLDPDFFTRGDDANIPPQSAVIRTEGFADRAFSRDWNLFPNRWAR